MELLTALVAGIILLSLLGIIVAFSPTLVITELTILTRSKKPVIQTIAFIAGIGLAVSLFCWFAVAFVDPAQQYTFPATHKGIRSIPLSDVIVGILLVIIASRLARPRSTVQAKQAKFKPEKLLATKTLFWFGFLKMATSLSSIAAIMFAAQFIKTSFDAGSAQFVSMVWLIIIALLPFILIALLKEYRPQAFQKIQNASDRAVELNWRRVVSITFALLGIYLIISGTLDIL